MKKYLLSVAALSLVCIPLAQADDVAHAASEEVAKNAPEETFEALDTLDQVQQKIDTAQDVILEAHDKSAEAENLSAHASEDDHAHEVVHWGYSGEGAASKWGSLDAKYEICATGMKQSPVNIDAFMRDDALPDINLSYVPSPLTVVNNGHTIQVNYAGGSTVNLGDQVFELLHLHFHTPSEHYLDGNPFAMEVHFVHKNAEGELGVLGVMMQVGEVNPVIQTIWENAPVVEGQNIVGGSAINAADLFPADKRYYEYSGSLTTPPCSENVHWHVLKSPIEISQEQLVAFQGLFPVNARPVQPLNGRVVKSK